MSIFKKMQSKRTAKETTCARNEEVHNGIRNLEINAEKLFKFVGDVVQMILA